MPPLKPEEAIHIRKGEELDVEAINHYLQKNVIGFGQIIDVKQYPGGYSNLTYLLITQDNEYVLRRGPFGANIKAAHDMGREYKVLSALKGHYAEIPEVVIFCDDISVIGATFYLMKKVSGIILRAKNISKIDLEANKWKKLSEMLVNTLASLHQIDIYKTGLLELGKPDGYVDRQIEGWVGRYSKSKTEEIAEMEKIAIWLNNNKPKPQKAAFIHNDFKYDNVVFDEQLNKVVAVLDWEMATVGDPLMDLGAMLAYWVEAGEGDFLKTMNISWLAGNLNRKQIVEIYASKTGIDTGDILFYYVFGLYKNAVIVQQIFARWKQGLTQDVRFEKLIYGVKELSKRALEAIEQKSI